MSAENFHDEDCVFYDDVEEFWGKIAEEDDFEDENKFCDDDDFCEEDESPDDEPVTSEEKVFRISQPLSAREEFFFNKEIRDEKEETERLKNMSNPDSDLIKCAIPESRYFPIPDYKAEREFLPGLRKGRVGVLSASGSTGKSFFCLQLALACAGGGIPIFSPRLELLKENIRIIYITAEEDTSDIDRRLRDIVTYYKKSFTPKEVWKSLLKHLLIIPMQGHPPCVFDSAGPTNGLKRLEKLCDDFRPELLIIDPLSQFHRADENDNGEMTRVMQVFSHLASVKNCAVLITHHMSKGAVLSGQGNFQQATRGASALVDSARWVMTMSKPIVENRDHQKTEEGRKILCSFPKLNNHMPIDSFHLFRGPGGVLDVENMWGGLHDENYK